MQQLRVVLLEDIPKLGKIGDLRRVAAGYARNYLVPRGLAVTATAERLNDTQFQQDLEGRRLEAQRLEAERFAGLVQSATVVIAVRVGAQGRMHGQITNQDVALALQEQLGTEIDRHDIQIDSPIRSLGRYLLPMRIAAGVEASVTLEVIEQVEEPEEPEETGEPEETKEAEPGEPETETAEATAEAVDAPAEKDR